MIKIFETEQEVAEAIAKEMEEQHSIEQPVFCLASGATPAMSYERFAKACAGKKELAGLRFVSLDEWVGIDGQTVGSCYQMLEQDLFQKLPLKKEQIIFFDTVSNEPDEECRRIDSFIKEHPITFSLMGVGMNGHIGLNEPGCEVLDHSTVVPLSETTKRVAQKYFEEDTRLEEGITIGLKQVIDSRRVIVVMTGEHKSKIALEILSGSDDTIPARKLLGYEHIDFYLDKAAAALLKSNETETAEV